MSSGIRTVQADQPGRMLDSHRLPTCSRDTRGARPFDLAPHRRFALTRKGHPDGPDPILMIEHDVDGRKHRRSGTSEPQTLVRSAEPFPDQIGIAQQDGHVIRDSYDPSDRGFRRQPGHRVHPARTGRPADQLALFVWKNAEHVDRAVEGVQRRLQLS